MNSKLAIHVGGKYLSLPPDSSIDYEDLNPYFNERESFMYPMQIPIEGNRHVVRNVDSVHSGIRALDLERQPVGIEVCGVPFRNGYWCGEDGEEIDTMIGFSSKSVIDTLSTLISNMDCRDVPVKDKIQIGEMIGNVKAIVEYNWRLLRKLKIFKSPQIIISEKADTVTHQFELQALGFSYPGICEETDARSQAAVQQDGKPKVLTSFINTADPYPAKPYCNSRVCYTHYEKDSDNQSSDVIATKGTYDPFYVLEANRAQSGVCFYLLYFLDCLFANLGISYDNSNLTSVGDLCRLAFFTTHCKYDLERKTTGYSGSDFLTVDAINKWLSSRQTNGKLSFDNKDRYKDVDSLIIDGTPNTTGKGLDIYGINDVFVDYLRYHAYNVNGYIEASVMKMYANSDNFPNESVQSIIDSLWGSFGIRFMMDYERNVCKPILIRDLYRDTASPIDIKCEIISIYPVSEKIKGVRMKYSAESTTKEQLEMIRSGEKDYDTNYDYRDYSKVDSTLTYPEIVKKQSSSDKTCYVDKTTGNAYRIKVNADADTATELKPSIFEVATYKGVELGDCTDDDEEDLVQTIESNFEPVIFNDVNGKNQKAYALGKEAVSGTDDDGNTRTIYADNSKAKETILAPFIDEDMWHENCQMTINNVVSSDYADFEVEETLTTDEAYDPSSTDDGNSPLQEMDWGLAVAVMRGGGADATIESYDHDYDGFGTAKWRTVSGQYALSSDSIDNFGSEYDYNGTEAGVGSEERFSLKIRAYKEVNGQILCNDDERDASGNVTKKVRSRGLHDTFMSEHTHFLLHRKVYRAVVQIELAQLTLITDNWHRRFRIGSVVGWINKVNTRISMENGLENVEIEMYSL